VGGYRPRTQTRGRAGLGFRNPRDATPLGVRSIGRHKHPGWPRTCSETGRLSRIDFYILAVIRISTIKAGKARRCIWTIVEAGGIMPE